MCLCVAAWCVAYPWIYWCGAVCHCGCQNLMRDLLCVQCERFEFVFGEERIRALLEMPLMDLHNFCAKSYKSGSIGRTNRRCRVVARGIFASQCVSIAHSHST